MSESFRLVAPHELKPRDHIILDDGSIAEVRGMDTDGCSKDQMRLRLKGRQPLVIEGYWRPIARRVDHG